MCEKHNLQGQRPVIQRSKQGSSIWAAELAGVGDTQFHRNLVPTHSHRRVCVSRTSTWDGSITCAAAQDRGCGGDNCISRWVQSWRKCRFLEHSLNKLLLTDDDCGAGRRRLSSDWEAKSGVSLQGHGFWTAAAQKQKTENRKKKHKTGAVTTKS